MNNNDASGAIQQQQQQQEALVGQGVGRVNQAFSGFTPQFYQGATNANLASTLPQFGNQFRKTQQGLGYRLADAGLLGSSTARDATQSLNQEAERQRTAVGDQAIGASRNLEQQVQGEKSRLIGQVVAGADPTVAGQQALESASSLSAPSLIAPLGNMFSTWANTYLAGQIGKLFPVGATPIAGGSTYNPSGGGPGSSPGVNLNFGVGG